MRQAELADRLRADLTAARARPRALVGSMRPNQRLWHPPSGGWSVDEVLEHLCAIGSPYMPLLAEKTDLAGPLAGPDEPWKGRLGGRLLVWSFGLRRSMPTLKAYEHPVPRPDVLAAMEGQLETLAGLMERSHHLAWRRIRFASPLASMVGLNLGDAFGVLVYHALRHFGQIERVTASEGFPA